MRLNHRSANRFYGEKEVDMQVEIKGIPQDVLVIYEVSRDEPDVNYQGGIEINGIYFEDEGCQMDNMTDDEIAYVQGQIESDVTASMEDAE